MSEKLHKKSNVLAGETLNHIQSSQNAHSISKQNTLHMNTYDTPYSSGKHMQSSNGGKLCPVKQHTQKHRSSPPQSRHRHINMRSASLYPASISSPQHPAFYDYNTGQYAYANNTIYNYEYNSSNGNETSTTATTNSPSASILTDEVEVFGRLNREDLMIDHFRWLSEKPLSVLQLDPADRAVLKIAGTLVFFF